MGSDCTIGEAARRASVGVETIRFYERRKLIARPPTPKTGARRYATEDIERIRLIKHLQSAGFSLKEIDTVLSLKDQGQSGCATLGPIIAKKMLDLRAEITALENVLTSLADLVATCVPESEADCRALTPRKQPPVKGNANGRTRLSLQPVAQRAHKPPR